jgi:asparagine synthase (glutamine-hydrolysing)
VTADARLDNREDLLRDLHLEAEARDRVVGDVELIARAYGRWGEQCVAHLVGDFAFALWDAAEASSGISVG